MQSKLTRSAPIRRDKLDKRGCKLKGCDYIVKEGCQVQMVERDRIPKVALWKVIKYYDLLLDLEPWKAPYN